jgi:acetyl esterase/lipase
VVYGRRDGLALTMDRFTPAKSNGAGIIVFVSAGFRSNRDLLDMFHPTGTTPFLDRGYTVFCVLLSSQPKYTVPEILDDAHRAVRFVRHHAKEYGIDPERIGVTGGSAGGHLSLMMGCAGKCGDPNSKDPIERQSSKAAAVACFFPPTDFVALEAACTLEFEPLFDIREIDPSTGKSVSVSAERRREIGRAVSPLTHASRESCPVRIIHGDKDTLVPIAQSEVLIDKLRNCGIACDLVVKSGKGHFWLGIDKDVPILVDWFDRHLLVKD